MRNSARLVPVLLVAVKRFTASAREAIGGGALPGSVEDVKDKAGDLFGEIKGAAEGKD